MLNLGGRRGGGMWLAQCLLRRGCCCAELPCLSCLPSPRVTLTQRLYQHVTGGMTLDFIALGLLFLHSQSSQS